MSNDKTVIVNGCAVPEAEILAAGYTKVDTRKVGEIYSTGGPGSGSLRVVRAANGALTFASDWPVLTHWSPENAKQVLREAIRAIEENE